MDGDMYESTIQALTWLYPKLAPGGYVLADDYALAGAKAAVDDFRAAQGIADPIHKVDWTAIYWQRSA
jgi:O-methyltransferase